MYAKSIVPILYLFLVSFATGGGVQCSLQLDREVLPLSPKQKAIVKINLDGLAPVRPSQRPPVNLSVVLDRSGSMKGAKLAAAKEGTILALRRLNADDIFSLVVYDHEVQTLIPPRHVTDRDALERIVQEIGTGGYTALFGGVSQGAAEVRKHLNQPYIHRVLLLSDGLANVGPSSPAELGRLGAALLEEGISVTTLGVGDDFNEDMMIRLSQASDGNSYYAASSNELPAIFARELGDVLTVVAKSLTLTITCEKGIKPLRLIGREGAIRGQQVELFFNQIYGQQTKVALLEVEISREGDESRKPVALAEARYQDVVAQKESSIQSQKLAARFSADQNEVMASANYEVEQEVLLNALAAAQDQAVDLADKGKVEEALQQLNGIQRLLEAKGQEQNDQVLLEKARANQSLTESISNEGMTKKNRKLLRTDSYQTRNQQSDYKGKTPPEKAPAEPPEKDKKEKQH